MMWFPELFNRFETFERLEPGTDTSVCQVSSVYIQQDGNKNTADLCGSAVGESVYTHTLWIGIACIPTSLWLPLCVHRLGAKFFLGKKLQTLPLQAYLTIAATFVLFNTFDFFLIIFCTPMHYKLHNFLKVFVRIIFETRHF